MIKDIKPWINKKSVHQVIQILVRKWLSKSGLIQTYLKKVALEFSWVRFSGGIRAFYFFHVPATFWKKSSFLSSTPIGVVLSHILNLYYPRFHRGLFMVRRLHRLKSHDDSISKNRPRTGSNFSIAMGATHGKNITHFYILPTLKGLNLLFFSLSFLYSPSLPAQNKNILPRGGTLL